MKDEGGRVEENVEKREQGRRRDPGRMEEWKKDEGEVEEG